MKLRVYKVAGAATAFLILCIPAFAHHAWSGYDMNNLTTIKGTVTQFDWGNPHVWISLDVKGEKDNIEKWNVGGPSPSRMANNGWDKNTLKPGDQITAIGHRISDGTNYLRTEKVVLADGREMICYGGR